MMVPYFTATHQISVGAQIRKREVNGRRRRNNVCTNHVTIRSELNYLITGKDVGTAIFDPQSGSNPA
jgi:hypothetical protein